MNQKSKSVTFWVVFLAFLCLVPQVFGILKTNLCVEFAIGAVYAVSLNLLLSYSGLLSFGHALFFGSGAYATALALRHIEGLSVWSAVGFGAVSAGVVAAICAPLLVRVSGTAFAMLTLAFGQLMFVICLKFREITGGEDGISGFPIPPLWIPGLEPIDLVYPTNFYYFAMFVLGISMGLMWFLIKTPFGNVMFGIRDNPKRMDYLGYELAPSKAIICIVSGVFAGIAGSMFALFQNVVSTGAVLSIMVSFTPIMAILVGGMRTFFGPVVGVGVLLLIREFTMNYTERVELVTGLIFIAIVLYMPGGVFHIFNLVKMKWFPRALTTAEVREKR